MSDNDSRDIEFIRIMKGELGENGMNVITNLGFYFVAYIFIIIIMLIMFFTTYKEVTEVKKESIIKPVST